MEALISQMTVGELAQRAGVDVEALVALALGGKTSPAPAKSKSKKQAAAPAKAKKAAPAKAKGVDTRTAQGREAYQQAMLGYLQSEKGEKVGATQIRSAVGGTGLQARAALSVLIDGKKVRSEGKARAKRYWAK